MRPGDKTNHTKGRKNPVPDSRAATRGGAGTLALYWDYELQAGADACLAGPQSWGRDDHDNTARLLDVLDEYDVKCTFAVLAFAAETGGLPYHAPRQIQEIARRGHEIASHSYRHEFIPDMSFAGTIAMLRKSKDILENLVGRPVTGFVPPHNLPNRFLQRGCIGLYQARNAKRNTMDVPKLLRALAETDFHTCRLLWRSIGTTVADRLRGARTEAFAPEYIHGILTLRINSNAGFDAPAYHALDQAARKGAVAVIYAHPHSLTSGGAQDFARLKPFLEEAARARRQSRLRIRTAEEILSEPAPRINL